MIFTQTKYKILIAHHLTHCQIHSIYSSDERTHTSLDFYFIIQPKTEFEDAIFFYYSGFYSQLSLIQCVGKAF